MSRPLPGWAVDLIRDGLPPRVLATPKGGGAKAVYKALVRTAAAAQNSGRTQSEWMDLLAHDTSALARQHRLRDGRKPRPALAVQKDLDSAWTKAAEWLADQDAPWTRDELAHEIAQRCEAARIVLADADAPLADSDRAVLAFACDEAERRGMTKVTLPRRAVMEATGLNQKAVRICLPRLVSLGLLDEVSPGKPGAPGSAGVKAAVYALRPADALAPYLCRETRPMGPNAQTYGPPVTDTPRAPRTDLWAPAASTADDNPQGRNPMDLAISLNTSIEEAQAVLAFLDERRAAAARADAEPTPSNVVPFDRARRTGNAS